MAQQQRQHKIEHSNALPLSLLCSVLSLSVDVHVCLPVVSVLVWVPPLLVGLCTSVCVCVCSFVRTFVWLSLTVCERERTFTLSSAFFFLLCLGKNESKAGQITKKRRICCASHAERFCFGLRAALFISSGGASTAQPIVCRCIGMRARRSRSRRRRCVCFCV